MSVANRLYEVCKDSYVYNFSSTPPNQLILFITSLCNFACETCFYWEKLNDTRNDLTFEELGKISSHFNEIKLLLLTGGEPYLRKNFFEIIKLFYDNNKVRKLHLPTNGYATKKIILDTERMLTELPELKVNIGISIDALGEKHDLISKKENAFDKAIETQRSLVKLENDYKNLRTQFYTVVSNDNIKEVDRLFAFIANEFGYEKIGFSPLRGDPAEPSLAEPSSDEWNEIFRMYKKYSGINFSGKSKIKQFFINRKVNFIKKINYQVMLEKGSRRLGRAFNGKGNKNFGPVKCSAGNNICVIDADGAVRVCELKQPIANLRDYNYDITKILKTKQKHTCTCTHACFQNSSIDISPTNYLRQFLSI